MAGLPKTNFAVSIPLNGLPPVELLKVRPKFAAPRRLSENIRRRLPTAKASRNTHESVTSPRCRVYRNAPEHFVAGGVIEKCSYLVSARRLKAKNKKQKDYIMRLLLLAAAASFVLTGTAMADDPAPAKVAHHHHHHYREAHASVPAAAPADAAPADLLNAHETYMQSLRESGYNPANDRTAAGNLKAN